MLAWGLVWPSLSSEVKQLKDCYCSVSTKKNVGSIPRTTPTTMDPLGVESLDEPTRTDRTSLPDDAVPTPETGPPQEPVMPPPTLSSGVPADPPAQPDHFNDIFGNFFSPVNRSGGDAFKNNQSFFGLEEAEGQSGITPGEPDMSSLAKLELAARETDVSGSSSLFDDLLDFSTPGSSDLDQILQDNMATEQKPVAPVDLLFGVDLDLPVSPSNEMTDSKVKTPDILDFVDICNDLPEVSLTDAGDSLLVCEPVTDDWNLVTEVSSGSSHMIQPTPDIVVTTCGENVDQSPDDSPALGQEQQDKKTDEQNKESKDDKEKDKPVESCNTESADKVERNSVAKSEDFDFSVIELRPAMDALNFDHSKHRRNISMRGSIANRKKPKRSTILAQNEGGIFADSTEPKKSQQEAKDEADGSQPFTSGSSQSETLQDTSSDKPELTSPSRKPTGGIRIPGLLEGLNKSKVFNKSDKSPVRDQAGSLQTSSLPSVSAAHKVDKTSSPPSAAADSTNLLSSPPSAASVPAVRTKPLVLPRVLPKPTTKPLKETQNQTTASTGVSRAASFRTSTTTAFSAEHPSWLKGSTTLSRSASVKVPGVSVTNKPQSPSLAELKTSPHGTADQPPPKEEANKPVSPITFRAANKTPPPPVSAKPAIAAKPRKTSLGPSTANQSALISASSSNSSQSALKSTSLTKGQSPLQFTQTKETKQEPLDTPQGGHLLESAAERMRPDSASSSEFLTAVNSVANETKPSTIAVNGHNKIHSSSVTNTDTALKNKVDKTDAVNVSSNSKDTDMVKIPTTNQQPPFLAKKPQNAGLFRKSENKLTDNLKEPEQVSKELKVDVDDVFDAKDGSENTSTQTRVVDVGSSDNVVNSEAASCDSTQHRKSSISGVSHVRYPSISDKPAVVNVGRKGSVSGSAYNPIGFRPTIGSGSSDGEQRSRGNSVSNATDGVSPSALVTTDPFKAEAVSPSGGQRSQNGSLNVSTSALEKSTKSPQNKLDKTDSKPPKITAVKPTPSIIPKKVEDKKKEAANDTNVNIQGPAKPLREASPHGSSNGKISDVPKEVNSADRKSSPWNVQLKKVDRKETPPVPDPAVKVTSSSTVNWRQQLSQRQRPAIPPKEGDKPKSESAPDWAKMSIKRRQRLIESGVIQGDS